MFNVTNKISGWGNYPVCDALFSTATNENDVLKAIRSVGELTPRGNGRSYGDAAIGKRVLCSLGLNKITGFDKQKSTLTCQSGVLLIDLLNYIVPHGFFLNVVPGTKYITIGGAVAADVHGKNHFRQGSFSRCVAGFRLMTHTGELLHCSSGGNSDLFYGTFGGMGLTGFITEVDLQLTRIETTWIEAANLHCDGLYELFACFDKHNSAGYKIGWYDCFTSRGIFTTGRHLQFNELDMRNKQTPLKPCLPSSINVPFFMPRWIINRYSIRLMNRLRLRRTVYGVKRQVTFDSFFFPLDIINNWNRMYGKQGFLQFQYAVPTEHACALTDQLLNIAKSKGIICLLAVVKQLGPGEDKSPLSFPMEGFTVALDFKNQPGLIDMLKEFAHIVAARGGRVYLAKDACMDTRAMLAGYTQLPKFREIVNGVNNTCKFNSNQSSRIGFLHE
ncbi:MAG TPA: FAD-binding oxidoreductase [Chitinophagales bacterium]|nr:FAD-binding oxidoreductase [Chitinophagales bacterium]